MTRTKAFGAVVAMPVARSRTMPALICRDGAMSAMPWLRRLAHALNRSSLIARSAPSALMNLLQEHWFSPRHLGFTFSSRSIEDSRRLALTPGLRGTPAGMTTISAPARVFFKPSLGGRYPSTFAGVAICERSAATPGVFTISNKPNLTVRTYQALSARSESRGTSDLPRR